jgi:hypothetical protein
VFGGRANNAGEVHEIKQLGGVRGFADTRNFETLDFFFSFFNSRLFHLITQMAGNKA